MQELTRDAGRHLVNAIAFGHLGHGKDRPAPPEWARSVHEEHAPWWKQRNVIGLAVGHKLTAGRRGRLALVVFVRRKLPREHVPGKHLIPSDLDGSLVGIRGLIPVDVRKVGPGRAEALTSADRPAQPGYSVGNRVGGSGTIGCVVEDRATSSLLGLTCAHVLAPLPSSKPGERVLVPSLPEARAHKVLARAPMGVIDRILPPSFGDSASLTNLDVATFRPSDPATLDSAVAIVGKRPSGTLSNPSVGMPVRKVGASSELTTGEVKFVNVVFWLAYPTTGGDEKTAGFQGVTGISHFSNPGDSGSLVMTDDRKAVGIVLGSTPEFTICLPIQRALDALNCDLVTE